MLYVYVLMLNHCLLALILVLVMYIQAQFVKEYLYTVLIQPICSRTLSLRLNQQNDHDHTFSSHIISSTVTYYVRLHKTRGISTLLHINGTFRLSECVIEKADVYSSKWEFVLFGCTELMQMQHVLALCMRAHEHLESFSTKAERVYLVIVECIEIYIVLCTPTKNNMQKCLRKDKYTGI